MARLTGLDAQHLQRLVTGERLPGLRTLVRLSEALAVPLADVAAACLEAEVYHQQKVDGLRALAGL